MQINATLFGQAIAFLVFVLFTWKWIWPMLDKLIVERQKKIADGLAAASRGEHALEDANKQALEIVKEARAKAAQIVDQANRRGADVIEEARTAASAEGERLIGAARNEIASESARARGELRGEVSKLALAGAARVLGREVDAKAHAQLLDELAARIAAG